MEDETTQVGNSESASGDGQSSGAGSQQSVDLATILSRLEGLENRYKGIQKGTDKVNARVEQRVGELLSSERIGRIAELAKAGKDSAEIENQLLLEDILAERKGKASGAVSGNSGAGGGSEGTAILKGIADAFGLDANDAAVAEALSKNDPAALAKIAKDRFSVPAPDGSDAPPVTSRESRGEDANTVALRKAYDAEVAKLRKDFNGRIPVAQLANLKISYRKKGLQIY
jgi:hypothetical protein